ncbi:unnamed protein product, partial [Iphiclides podalirius]
MSGEPTLTESPVPLALARLQTRPGRVQRGLRAHRPSLTLASLQEAADETPRRYSDGRAAPDTDDDDTFGPTERFRAARPATNGRRASEATFAERYRKLHDFDGPPPEAPRRASLAVPAGDGFGPATKAGGARGRPSCSSSARSGASPAATRPTRSSTRRRTSDRSAPPGGTSSCPITC